MFDDPSISRIAEALGHNFERLELLRDALTHRSFANEQAHLAPSDNERLEFLGDAVIEMVTSLLLLERYPDASEGELTRRRADVVCEAGLAAIATELDLGPSLRLGKGEDRSGGRDKPRLLASALEACMGAILLDGGPGAVLAAGRRLFEPHIVGGEPGQHDYKSRLQELAQAQGHGTPRYQLVRAEGPDHERRFHVALLIGGEQRGEGEGRSKLEAEQAAAEAVLSRMQDSDG